ncbi:MAG: GNAT family N-acetyltransferase [Cohnella sp.]|nr:GNAT family N-acetyltransferase [Cohnella sp.]
MDRSIAATRDFTLGKVETEQQAQRIVNFLFSRHSFDDARHTPGEEAHFRELPYRALRNEILLWVVYDPEGKVIAVSSAAENEQRTGGYSWDYIVVHRDYRKFGLASVLIAEMLAELSRRGARYLITYTCSLPEYGPIRRLFECHGFKPIGICPDYYYEGEDRLIYGRKLV